MVTESITKLVTKTNYIKLDMIILVINFVTYSKIIFYL